LPTDIGMVDGTAHQHFKDVIRLFLFII